MISQNEAQKLMKLHPKSNNNLREIETEKFGCHICDHNINTIEESCVEFLNCITNLKKENELVDQQNYIKSQSLTAIQNSLDNSQIQVPLINNCKTTNAIQNTLNTSAKHKTNQNGSQLSQTNNENKLTNGKALEDLEKYNNSKHKSEDGQKNNSVEEKEMTDALDW